MDDILSKEGLERFGFLNFTRIKELLSHGLPQDKRLEKFGVYTIVVPKFYKVNFLPIEETSRRRNVKKPCQLEKLNSRWVEGTDVIYFGCAGAKENAKTHRSLRKRLADLMNHCKGKTSDKGPHKGGEIIWQLKGYNTFQIGYLPTGDPPEPRNLEKRLNCAFKSLTGTGRLLFGNRRI